MTRLETELAWMLRLLAPPFTAAWKAYVWDKAKRLAESDPEFAELPRLLTDAMKSAASTSQER